MADDYGPAQPIADVVGGAVKKARKFLGYVDKTIPDAPEKKESDYSKAAHAKDLADVAEGFRKRDAAAKTEEKPSTKRKRSSYKR